MPEFGDLVPPSSHLDWPNAYQDQGLKVGWFGDNRHWLAFSENLGGTSSFHARLYKRVGYNDHVLLREQNLGGYPYSFGSSIAIGRNVVLATEIYDLPRIHAFMRSGDTVSRAIRFPPSAGNPPGSIGTFGDFTYNLYRLDEDRFLYVRVQDSANGSLRGWGIYAVVGRAIGTTITWGSPQWVYGVMSSDPFSPLRKETHRVAVRGPNEVIIAAALNHHWQDPGKVQVCRITINNLSMTPSPWVESFILQGGSEYWYSFEHSYGDDDCCWLNDDVVLMPLHMGGGAAPWGGFVFVAVDANTLTAQRGYVLEQPPVGSGGGEFYWSTNFHSRWRPGDPLPDEDEPWLPAPAEMFITHQPSFIGGTDSFSLWKAGLGSTTHQMIQGFEVSTVMNHDDWYFRSFMSPNGLYGVVSTMSFAQGMSWPHFYPFEVHAQFDMPPDPGPMGPGMPLPLPAIPMLSGLRRSERARYNSSRRA